MTHLFKTVIAAAIGLFVAVQAQTALAAEKLVLETTKGTVEIELMTTVAPRHVAQIKKLAKEGFYDGVIFHRVIEGFMAQTGDPTGTGRGGSNEPDIPAEFSNVPFERGVVGMARTSDPNSANSQFFIMFDSAPFLNGDYTVFGRVVSGMDAIDSINRGEPPSNPDRIVKMTVTRN
ncbi:MAG: peptidylprolyl isomerase [Pseudomonadota bacterium]